MVSLKNLFLSATLAVSAIAAPHNLHEERGLSLGSSKRGAAYNDISLVKALLEGGSVGWAYNWDSKPSGILPPGVKYVPMLWGTKKLDTWTQDVEQALSSGSNMIFGFNEPDNGGQSQMSVSDAVSLYKQHITPYGNRATLVTPAVTSAEQPGKGLDWMKNFIDSCPDCGASIMAVHWYGNDAGEFKKFVNQAVDLAHQKGLKEVWVSEFALNDISQAVPFLTQVLPWLDQKEGVGGYAYFYCASGYLLDGTNLSPSGKVYTSL